jgi:hypothetical protein
MEAKAASKRPRRKTANLIYLSEIFTADGKKQITRESLYQWECQARVARRKPVNASAR